MKVKAGLESIVNLSVYQSQIFEMDEKDNHILDRNICISP